MFVTFALLTAAILSLWLVPDPRAPLIRHLPWLGCYSAALVAALAHGFVAPLGVLWLALLTAALLLFDRAPAPTARRILAAIAIVVLTAGLFTHLLPGFANPVAISTRRFTPDALPFRLHLNFDKASAGLLLFAFLHPRARGLADWNALLRPTLLIAAATVSTLLLLSLVAGYVRFDPKLPPETLLFLWANLFLTCLAEEALFRGFIQAQLARCWAARRHGPLLALVVAAVLFGLAHAAGGPTYIALSTLAGLGYGAAYWRSGYRLEAAIFTHAAVNAFHFIGFTYPALARS